MIGPLDSGQRTAPRLQDSIRAGAPPLSANRPIGDMRPLWRHGPASSGPFPMAKFIQSTKALSRGGGGFTSGQWVKM